MSNPILLISKQSALIRPINKAYNLPSHQRGAALIVVLLFLVLILLAGAIAVPPKVPRTSEPPPLTKSIPCCYNQPIVAIKS